LERLAPHESQRSYRGDFKTEFCVRRQVFDIYDIARATFSEQNVALEQKWQLLNYFDGAPPLSCIEFPSVQTPVVLLFKTRLFTFHDATSLYRLP
jgi:hypothetical protein